MGLDMYLCKRKKLNEEEKKELQMQKKIYQEASDKLDKIASPIYAKYEDKMRNPFSKECNEAREDYQKELENTPSYKMQKNIRDKADKRIAEIEQIEDIGYWRKHPDLHGYLEDLYIERGGTGEFNCVELPLSEEDCEDIIELAKQRLKADKNDVKHTQGFFFGETQLEQWEETISIFEKALNTVNFDIEEIYYDSWW